MDGSCDVYVMTKPSKLVLENQISYSYLGMEINSVDIAKFSDVDFETGQKYYEERIFDNIYQVAKTAINRSEKKDDKD